MVAFLFIFINILIEKLGHVRFDAVHPKLKYLL